MSLHESASLLSRAVHQGQTGMLLRSPSGPILLVGHLKVKLSHIILTKSPNEGSQSARYRERQVACDE